MESFFNALEKIVNLFKWWVVILPWEQGIRITFGSKMNLIGPGVHVAIPVVHSIFKQSSRMRRLDVNTQTLTTSDGKCIVLGAALQYAIVDIVKLYNGLHNPDSTLAVAAQERVANFITTHPAEECTVDSICERVSAELDFSNYGLGGVKICIVDFAFIRAYRVLMDQRYSNSALDVDTPSRR